MSRFSIALLILVLGDTSVLQAQTTILVDRAASGAQASLQCCRPAISADGRYVVFDSYAPNLVPGDLNTAEDDFLFDHATGSLEIVSVDSQGVQGDHDSFAAVVSANGRYVAFSSDADNLVTGDTNGCADVFVRDRVLGLTERVSLTSSGGESNDRSIPGGISDDGRFVTFQSIANNLVPNDTNGCFDVFVRDRLMGTTMRVSVTTAGSQGSSDSLYPAISGNGRFVTFESQSQSFGASLFHTQVFVYDLASGTLEMVSVDPSGSASVGSNNRASISNDGRWVAFMSTDASLVVGDTNPSWDVLVRDRVMSRTFLASVNSSGIQQNGFAMGAPRISADGRHVVWVSDANNLVPGDTNGLEDVFLRDLTAGTTTRLSVSSSGQQADDISGNCVISADGRYVAFESFADNLVPSDINLQPDVFLSDSGPPVAGMPYCFGDGLGTPCPCNNTSPVGADAGCLNSLGVGGKLAAFGVASVASDSVVLIGNGMPDSFALYFQSAQASAGIPFGDGLRCATGPTIRLATHLNVAGTSHYPGASDPAISVKGAVVPGSVRSYQCWYRNAAPFCQPQTFNLTNGVQITWAP